MSMRNTKYKIGVDRGMSTTATYMLMPTMIVHAILFSMFTIRPLRPVSRLAFIFFFGYGCAYQDLSKPISIDEAYAMTLIGSITGHGKTLVSFTPKLPLSHYYLFNYQDRTVIRMEGRALGNLLPKLLLTNSGFGVLDPFKKKLVLLDPNLEILSKEDLRHFKGHQEEHFYRSVSPYGPNQALITTWQSESNTLGFALLNLNEKTVEQLFNFDPDETKKGNFWGFANETLYYFDQTYRLVEIWDPVSFERKKSLLPKRDPVKNKNYSTIFDSPVNTRYQGLILNPVFTNIGVLVLEDLSLDSSVDHFKITDKRMLLVENQKALIQPFGPVKVGEWEGVQLIFDMDTGDFSFKDP